MANDHKPGCDALGGYGHGVGPCTCGALTSPVAPEQVVAAVEGAKGLLREAVETIDTLPGYPKGAELCDRIERYLSKPDDTDFNAGICAALAVVREHDKATLWSDIVRTVDIDSLLQHAAHVDPDVWEWAGFAKYAENEIGRSKPAKIATPPAATPAAPSAEVLVPLKPTPEMLRSFDSNLDGLDDDGATRQWDKLMSIAALAQPAPVQAGAQQAAEISLVSWDWMRGVINALPSTPSGCYELIARHDVQAWIDEAERREILAASAQQAVAEIVTFGGGGSLKEVSWHKGKMPPVGTKLYAAPTQAGAGDAKGGA